MTTIKQFFITATCLTAATLAQAVSMEGFDRKTLNPYINEAQEIIDNTQATITRSLSDTHSIQKDAIKAIAKRLHQLANELKKAGARGDYIAAKQLYQAFKKDVYKVWKKTGALPALQ
jgi:hypothetical protein